MIKRKELTIVGLKVEQFTIINFQIEKTNSTIVGLKVEQLHIKMLQSILTTSVDHSGIESGTIASYCLRASIFGGLSTIVGLKVEQLPGRISQHAGFRLQDHSGIESGTIAVQPGSSVNNTLSDHSGIESGTIERDLRISQRGNRWTIVGLKVEQLRAIETSIAPTISADHSGIESGTILKHAETDEEAVRDHSGIESGTISRFIEGLLRSDFARP